MKTKPEPDEIIIRITGSEDFRQRVVDCIYDAINVEDEYWYRHAKPGDQIEITSTLEPIGDDWY